MRRLKIVKCNNKKNTEKQRLINSPIINNKALKEEEMKSGSNFDESTRKKIVYLEGGMNFIFYLFGRFIGSYFNINVAEKILDIKTWTTIETKNKELEINEIYNKLHTIFPENKQENKFIGIKFTQTNWEQETEKPDCLLAYREKYIGDEAISNFAEYIK